jgi:hypothetical protein
MKPGDTAHLAPCASKPDQFGEQHCTFASALRYDGTPLCAAGALRGIELDWPCHGVARDETPLFADPAGAPYSYQRLNGWLHSLVSALYGRCVADTLSWHSFRIELACRLRAVDCPDSTIQLICRWACPESVQTYAQMGIQQNIAWLAKATAVQHDAVRTNNLPQLDNSEYFADFQRSRVAQQRTVASEASATPEGPPALPAVRTRVTVRWGEEWYDGLVTSAKNGLDAQGRDARLHHLLYDAARGFPPTRRWHSLADEDWRRL